MDRFFGINSNNNDKPRLIRILYQNSQEFSLCYFVCNDEVIIKLPYKMSIKSNIAISVTIYKRPGVGCVPAYVRINS